MNPSAGKPAKTPVRNYAIFLLAVAAIGVASGAFIWAFLFLMSTGMDLLWNVLPGHLGIGCFPLIACTIGGLIVGLCQKRCGNVPEDMMVVLGEVKKTGGYNPEKVKPAALCALVPLIFGGSIGPEAGLVGIISGLCTSIGNRLKHLGSEFRDLAAAGTAASISAVFGAPLFAIAAPLEDEDACSESAIGSISEDDPDARTANRRFPKWVRVSMYVLAAAGAFATIAGLNKLTGGSFGMPHFDGISFGNGEILAAIPALIAGVAAGWLFHAGEHLTHALARKIGDKPILKGTVAGIALGLCGTLLPLTMFSGEAQIHELMETWTMLGGGALIATGFVKVLLTPLCVNFGWRGGHFFPVIFAGTAIGFGFAIIAGVDPVLCASVGAAAVVGGVMRKPILTVLLLFLCYPITAAPVMLVAAFLGSIVPLPKAWK